MTMATVEQNAQRATGQVAGQAGQAWPAPNPDDRVLVPHWQG